MVICRVAAFSFLISTEFFLISWNVKTSGINTVNFTRFFKGMSHRSILYLLTISTKKIQF